MWQICAPSSTLNARTGYRPFGCSAGKAGLCERWLLCLVERNARVQVSGSEGRDVYRCLLACGILGIGPGSLRSWAGSRSWRVRCGSVAQSRSQFPLKPRFSKVQAKSSYFCRRTSTSPDPTRPSWSSARLHATTGSQRTSKATNR